MATQITFDDPNDPGNPGTIRIHGDDSKRVMTDHGSVAPSEVQPGWRVCRPRESWQTVLAVAEI